MTMFSYFYLGLQSMNAAQLGLHVTGGNMANALTPGYARRSVDFTTGYPIRTMGGIVDQGVDVAGIRRMEDLFLQRSLERELGNQAGSQELLRGLQDVESIYGSLESSGGIASALSGFSTAFDELAGRPDDPALRDAAVQSADALARAIRGAYERLQNQRGLEDQRIGGTVDDINRLSRELAELNREIAIESSTGGVAAPLLDQRNQAVGQLVELTGGAVTTGENGKIGFALPGGPTLVTGTSALQLTTSRATDGTLRIQGPSGKDITDNIRSGQLGAILQVRDDAISAQLADLDTLAGDLISRVNGLTTGAFDLNGNAGGPLFIPDPPGAGAGLLIAVDSALLQDSSLLAVSGDGTPGDSSVALLLAALPDESSVALGDRSAAAFFANMISGLGNDVVQADVELGVAQSLVDGLTARRDSVSGVSLDEEAVALIQFQKSYEAAARFIQVLNSVTEVAINLAVR